MAATPIPYAGLKQRVRGYIRMRVPREATEDVIQNTWLRIVKDWPSYDLAKGAAWPFAKYRCISAIAEYYRRRRPAQSQQDVDPPATAEPSPSDYELLLAVTFAAPSDLHQLIVFGYAQSLEWRPANLFPSISGQALENLVNRIVDEYSSRFPHHRNLILYLLRPFTERLQGQRTTLSDRFNNPDDEKTCAAEVSRWRHSVLRRIESDYTSLHALETLLTSSRPRHEQIVYGLVVMLRWTPQTLAKRYCHESLKKLAERLEAGLCSKRRHLMNVVQQIFRPLHHDPALTDPTLCDLVPEGRNPADEFALWCKPSERRKP